MNGAHPPHAAAQARADVRLNYTHAIRMPDVQALLLWVLGEGANPQWAFVQVESSSPVPQKGCRTLLLSCAVCFLQAAGNSCVWGLQCLLVPLYDPGELCCRQNKPLISKVAVVAVPGLSEDLFGSMTVCICSWPLASVALRPQVER